MLKAILFRRCWGDLSIIFFLLRLVMGLAFVFHGWSKIHSACHWLGNHPPFPLAMVCLVPYLELLGGAFLFFGFLTRIASLALFSVMTGALYCHIFLWHDAFVSVKDHDSYEMALVYWILSMLFFGRGAGRV
jgi:putative oxidoreductase